MPGKPTGRSSSKPTAKAAAKPPAKAKPAASKPATSGKTASKTPARKTTTSSAPVRNPYEPDKGVRRASSKKDIHVVPRDGEWAVKTPGASKAYRVTDTQKEALNIAKGVAKKRGGEVVTHGKDGKIRDKDSYGKDPNPPKDKKH